MRMVLNSTGVRRAIHLVALVVGVSMLTRGAFAAPSVCDAAPGNLITNCGFELGPVAQASLGFTSQYAYTSDLLPAGTFYIGSNPDLYNGFFGSPTAAPNSGNYMMIINGASTANTIVWQQTSITVAPNTNYYFSVFAASVDDISPAILDFTANGQQLGTTFTLNSGSGFQNMQEFFASWNSGSATSVTLSLVDQSTAFGGNDFALDDFIFSQTQPTSGTGVGGTGTAGSSPIPEPSTLLLLSTAVAVMARRRHGEVRKAGTVAG